MPCEHPTADIYLRLFNHLPDCLVVVDRDHRIILSNWRGDFEKIPGAEREGLPHCAAIFHPNDPLPEEACPATEVFRSGRPTTREIQHSQFGTLDCRAFPIFDQSGEDVVYVALQICNVSERKKLEKQLILCQKMETVSAMAAGLAHDFNNLLTVIGGFGRILQQAHTEPNLQQATEAILQAEQQARALVERLMMIGEGPSSQSENINLNEVIGGLERMLRTVLEHHLEHHIEVDFQLEPELGSIRGQADELEQIILNLAINARDAMAEGGRLTIATANRQLSKGSDIPGGILAPGPYLVLTVADTGHGMDETTREKIFEPFFSERKDRKGTGLGLVVVFSIVKRHRGHITVTSSPAGGTTFEIYLPHSDAPPPEDL